MLAVRRIKAMEVQKKKQQKFIQRQKKKLRRAQSANSVSESTISPYQQMKPEDVRNRNEQQKLSIRQGRKLKRGQSTDSESEWALTASHKMETAVVQTKKKPQRFSQRQKEKLGRAQSANSVSESSISPYQQMKPEGVRNISENEQQKLSKRKRKKLRRAQSANSVSESTISPYQQMNPEGVRNSYIMCPLNKRLAVLYTFIQRNGNKKIIVLVSSPLVADFFKEFLGIIDKPVLCTHEKQDKKIQEETFLALSNKECGVLFCTEEVIKNKLPAVDWTVQYDPPSDVQFYVKRLKRVIPSSEQRELLFITEEEFEFIRFLKSQEVQSELVDIPWSRLQNIQDKVDEVVKTRYLVYLNAKQGFSGYLKAYHNHPEKKMFDITKLNFQQAARNFGFRVPPFVDLAASEKNKMDESRYPAKKRKRSKRMKTNN